jgi:hypothetical protein
MRAQNTTILGTDPFTVALANWSALTGSALTIGGEVAGGPLSLALSGGYLAGNFLNKVPAVSYAAQWWIQPITDSIYNPPPAQPNAPSIDNQFIWP